MSDVSRRSFLESATLAAGVAGTVGGAARPRTEARVRRARAGLAKSCRRSGSPWRKARAATGPKAARRSRRPSRSCRSPAGSRRRVDAAQPGGIRELHWHAIAAEWAFVVKGRVRTTVIAPDGTSETNDFDPGDVWYFPRGHGHRSRASGRRRRTSSWSSTTAPSPSSAPSASPTGWGSPLPEVLSKSLGLPASAFAKFPKKELYIVQGRIPPQDMPRAPPGGPEALPPDAPLSPAGPAAPLAVRRRRGASRQRPRVPDLHHDDRRDPRPEARRRARTPLAPQRRRVAIHPPRPGPHRRLRLRRPRPAEEFQRATSATSPAATAITSRTPATSRCAS